MFFEENHLKKAALAISLLVLLFSLTPAFATCGGGGGGGAGGISPGPSTDSPEVYKVPWDVLSPGEEAKTEGLILYWFPGSAEEARASRLQTSRKLTLWAGQCVQMALVTPTHSDIRERFGVEDGRKLAVLTDASGGEVARLASAEGILPVTEVEDLVNQELRRLRDENKSKLKEASGLAKAGQTDRAETLYHEVWAKRCLLPKEAKKAVKGLKKIERPVPAEPEQAIVFFEEALWDEATSEAMTGLLAQGIEAERALNLAAAESFYRRAHGLDPSDPVALRYLAEFHRHHSGDWTKASKLFERLLATTTEPISRAIAHHGLGKIALHQGDFPRGLDHFDRSLKAWPTALTYRNLAVFWNSEGESEKAYAFAQEALALAPNDPYNRVFAATYSAMRGQRQEAMEIALRYESLKEASYNLAAIHALLGEKEKAVRLLRRHFYGYEQNDLLRAKEMQEARDDVVFASILEDPNFRRLTRLADRSTP